MISRLRNKVEQLRAQPEHKRVRMVMLLTWSFGGLAILLWALVLLPVQVYFTRDKDTEATVQGTTVTNTPTPSPSPTN